MDNKYPCTCGHLINQHANNKEWTGSKFCLKCFSWINGEKIAVCNEYVPDNLRYLEQKALDK